MEIFISSGLLQDQAVPRLSLWLLKWHTQVASPLVSTTSVQLWLMDLAPAAPSLFWIERRAGLSALLTIPLMAGVISSHSWPMSVEIRCLGTL